MDPNDLSVVVGELDKLRAGPGTAGWIAFALVAVYGLTRLTKLPSIDRLLGYRKWVRVVVAISLGALAGLLQALSHHQPWSAVAWGLVTGAVVAGLGAVGLDQAVSWLRPSARQASDISAGIKHTLEAKDSEVVARVDVLRTELESAKTVQDPAERRKALAAWGRRHLGVKP